MASSVLSREDVAIRRNLIDGVAVPFEQGMAAALIDRLVSLVEAAEARADGMGRAGKAALETERKVWAEMANSAHENIRRLRETDEEEARRCGMENLSAIVRESETNDAIAAARAAEARPTCEWREDWEGTWVTACGEAFVFNDGGPAKNGVIFCHHCGKAAVFAHYQEETDDDE